MTAESKSALRAIAVPAAVMAVFWILAIVMWQSSGFIQPLFFFGYIGTALGVGLGLYALLPRRRKPLGRRVARLLVGVFLFGALGLLMRENVQIEGVFFSLLAGTFYAAGTHYLIAKVFGPLLFGRLWCGWACWTGMILDLLPYKASSGRLGGRWGWLRYGHFALSLGVVLILWYALAYRPVTNGLTALTWFLAGNALYYLAGISLAFGLKDNRAFCKYLCPVTAFLKLGSRLSVVKVKGDAARCADCRSCVRACPMDIRIPDYVRSGSRVLSTECTLCQTCINTCPQGVLKLTAGLDLGGRELLRERAGRSVSPPVSGRG